MAVFKPVAQSVVVRLLLRRPEAGKRRHGAGGVSNGRSGWRGGSI